MTTFDFQDDNGPVPIDDLAHEIWAVAQLAPRRRDCGRSGTDRHPTRPLRPRSKHDHRA